MKRFFLMWGLVIALLLSGCGSSASHVETLKAGLSSITREQAITAFSLVWLIKMISPCQPMLMWIFES